MDWLDRQDFQHSLLRDAESLASGSILSTTSFRLFYQPIVGVHRGIVAIEALLRYDYHGQVCPPATFIPMLEQHGLFCGMGEAIFGQAIGDRDRMEFFTPAVGLALNVSSAQIERFGIVDVLRRCLKRAKTTPSMVALEISEQHDLTMEGIECVNGLKEAGHPIFLDDFGVGYSNIGRLIRTSPSVVKLDRFVLRYLTGGSGARTAKIVQSVVGLAHDLGITVTSEGIETPEQFEMMRDLGCDFFQGYHFSRPMPLETMRETLVHGVERLVS